MTMRTHRYYVSGIIQIEVWADNADEAGRKALERAQTLMERSPTLNIGIEVETAELKNGPTSRHKDG